jgi:hypothetical protein
VGTEFAALQVESWDGSSWRAPRVPTPAHATKAELLGVSCSSSTACTAVGDSTAGSTTSTLAERWNGSSWSIQVTANASVAPTSVGGVLISAAAPGPGQLTATATTGSGGPAADVAAAARARTLVVARAEAQVRKAGIVRISLNPDAAAKELLRRHRTLRVVIKLVFKPRHGRSTTSQLRVTFSLKPAR